MRTRPTRLLLGMALLALGATTGHAGHQLIRGKKFVMRDPGVASSRRVVVQGREGPASPNTIVGDPTLSGATLRVLALGSSSSDQTFALPAAGWTAINGVGFKFRGSVAGPAEVSKVQIKRSPNGVFLVKAVVRGAGLTTLPPNLGVEGGVLLTLGGGDTYCLAFGGPAGGVIGGNTAALFKVANPTADACPGAATACPPTLATARVIATASDVIDGQLSRGEVGDVLLANDRVQVTVQKPGRVMFGIGTYGGNIIDADLQRCNVGERDSFEELAPLINLENTPNYSSVTVLNDGTNGLPAVVRATGPDDLLDFINASSVVANFGFMFPASADDRDLPIDVQTDFVLETGNPYVRMETTVTNLDALPLDIYLGDATNGSGQVELFQPVYGFGEPLVTFPACPASTYAACTAGMCDLCNFIGWSGEDGASGVSYGYIHEVTGSTSFTTSGVAVSLLGRQSVFVLIGAELPNFHLAPSGSMGDALTLTRYFAVGDGSVASIEDTRNAIQGVTTGTLDGVVTSGGSPVPDADVVVLRGTFAGSPARNVADHFRTRADGSYSGTLAPGSYTVRVNKGGRLFGAPDPAPVTITAAMTTTQNFTLPDEGRLEVTVDDENGDPIPAKVQLVGFDPSPDPLNTQSVLGLISNTTGVFGAEVSDHDGLVYGVAQVFFADKTGSTGVVPMEPGTYQLAVSRGPRYTAVTQGVTVTAGMTTSVPVQLARVIDTPGFVAGDFHVHAINSPDSEVTNEERVATQLAEGMDFFTPSDHDYRTDFTPTLAAMDVTSLIATAPSAEITTFDYGHFNSWPVTIDPMQLHGGGVDWGRAGIMPGLDFPSLGSFNLTPADIYTTALGDPRPNLIQINHIRSHFNREGLDIDTAELGVGPPTSHTPAAARRLNPAVTNFYDDGYDALEVWIGTDGRTGDLTHFVGENLGDWFNLLNQGLFHTGVADSDTHQKRTTQINARTYVASAVTDPALLASAANADALAANVVAGKAVGTNAPFVVVVASATSTGETAGLGDGDSTLLSTIDGEVDITLTIQSPHWAQFDKVQFFVNAAPQPFDHDANVATRKRYRALANNLCQVASGCYEQVAPTDFMVTPVDVVPSIPGDERLDATVTLNLTGLTGDVWVVALVRGTDGVSYPLFPFLPNSIKQSTNTTLAQLTDGNLGEDGIMALAFTNPIYVDVDGGGWTAPGVLLTP